MRSVSNTGVLGFADHTLDHVELNFDSSSKAIAPFAPTVSTTIALGGRRYGLHDVALRYRRFQEDRGKEYGKVPVLSLKKD